jgi:Cu/Ag efflux protein CusF
VAGFIHRPSSEVSFGSCKDNATAGTPIGYSLSAIHCHWPKTPAIAHQEGRIMIKRSVLFAAALAGVSLSFIAGAAETAVTGKPVAAAANLQGMGVVNKVDNTAGIINISHEAIAALQWPAMTMDFKVADRKMLANLKAGQSIVFGLGKDPAVGYIITRIEPAK